MKINTNKLLFLIPVIYLAGCKKQVEVGPPITNPTSGSVYTSNAKAAAVLTGIYGKMSERNDFAHGTASIGLYAGLGADELETYSTAGSAYMSVYQNSRTVGFSSLWQELYQYIYIANAAIEGLTASQGVTEPERKQLMGEAKFMRAFLHFYLVNLWGDVPLVLTTDYRINEVIGRTSKEQVYHQIIADLKDAQDLLPAEFVTPLGATTTERVRPNKAAATALLARAYLYTGDWANAEIQATAVISNTKFSLSTLAGVFLKNSGETIWQVQPVSINYNCLDATMYIRTVVPSGTEPASLRKAFMDNFEAGDQRKVKWSDSVTINTVKYYYPSKYKVKGGGGNTTVSEYMMVLRLAEQYLIRGEARAQQNKITEAQSDLNAIRTRAGLGNTPANDKPSLLAAILHERQVELFTEWGHRWLDLKRTGTVDAVMSVVCPLKGGTWSPNWALYPIPESEIQKDPNLAPQNPGYN